jgi:hypothetical protein
MKMINNTFKKITTLAIFMAVFAVVPSFSFAESPTPSVTDPGNAGSVDTSKTGPSVTDPGNAGTTSTGPSVTDPGNAGSVDTSKTGPSVTDPGNAGTTSGGGSNTNTIVYQGSGGAAGGYYAPVASTSTSSANTNVNIIPNTESCSYLVEYMRLDGNNNPIEVTKLQAFLKNSEKLDVDINGIFDTKTFEAVKAFQAKYLEDIMIPWGSRTPSGQVYFTTQKKVNEVYCNSPFALTAEQQAQIDSYKRNMTQSSIVGQNSTTTISNPNGTSTIDIGKTGDSSQTAAAHLSLTARTWNFIKWLFGY